ncbi:hypothetical protein JCM19237_826 [Photobacterium aphoticum]|uniref:Uncharacterized protein n=1 Tax=Photobacterium aphoticum TaxID=754436 RepID=A0A090QZA0_9GAMM|nr:hypothetical protein JCM19237_826 [Photobacterium aphoticum]
MIDSPAPDFQLAIHHEYLLVLNNFTFSAFSMNTIYFSKRHKYSDLYLPSS